MKILGIEHIGIAVQDFKKAEEFWSSILGIDHHSTENIDDQGVVTDIFDTGNGKIELLVANNSKSSIAKFLNKRGPGIHHICLKVENIILAIEELKRKGIKIIDDNYSIGAEGYKVVFIHPRYTGGVLLELAEAQD